MQEEQAQEAIAAQMEAEKEEEHPLFIKTLTGKTMTVFVVPTLTVAQVKQKLFEAEGIPVEQQRLVHSGKQLEDMYTLKDYYVAKGTTLHMILRYTPPPASSEEPIAPAEEMASSGYAREARPDVTRKSKEEYAAAFVPAAACSQADWVGECIDMFSPDDANPDSRRFIDLDEDSGELQVSADTGVERWGRRFDKSTSVNPVLAETDSPNQRKTSFLSKVPEDAPIYAAAAAGALNFTLTLGHAFGQKVMKWNGLYDGRGGKFGGNDIPASDCDNFWRYV